MQKTSVIVAGILSLLTSGVHSVIDFDGGCVNEKEFHFSSYKGVDIEEAQTYEKIAGYPNYDFGGKPPEPLDKKMDPCAIAFGDPSTRADLVKRTSFGKEYCTQKCIGIFMSHIGTACAPRRAPLRWNTEPFPDPEKVIKISCENLSLIPYSNGKTFLEIPHRYLHVVYDGESNSEMYSRDEDSFYKYVDMLKSLKPTHLDFTAFEDRKRSENSTFDPITYIIEAFNEVESLVLVSASDVPNLQKHTKKLKNLKFLSLDSVPVSTLDLFANPEKLIYFHFEPTKPSPYRDSWWYNPDLNFNPPYLRQLKSLKVFYMSGAIKFNNFNNFDQLTELEILTIKQADALHSVPVGFLAASTQLKILDLSCNGIEQIQSGAFDMFTELISLTLGGNPLHTIEPSILHPLKNLRALDVRVDRYQPDHRKRLYTNFRTLDNSIEKSCRGMYLPEPIGWEPAPVFVNQNSEHFLSLQGLRSLKLGDVRGIPVDHVPNVTIQPEIFDLLPNLNEVYIEGTSVTSMDAFKGLLKHCNIQYMSLHYNDFSDPSWIDLEWVSNLKKTLKMLHFGKSNVTKMTTPIYFLAKINENMKYAIDFSFKTNPVGDDLCQMGIWMNLLRNKKVLPELPGVTEMAACKAQYDEIYAEIQEWKDKIFSPENVKYCKLTSGGVHFIPQGFGIILGLAGVLAVYFELIHYKFGVEKRT